MLCVGLAAPGVGNGGIMGWLGLEGTSKVIGPWNGRDLRGSLNGLGWKGP